MSTPNDIIDMFADLHKSIYREVGTLMGRVLEGRFAAPAAAPVCVTDTNIEERLMKAMDERFAALEKAIIASRLSGQKRKHPETPINSDDSDDESVPAPAPASVSAEDAAVNEIVNGLATTTITDITPAVVKKQVAEEVEAAEEEDAADEEEEEEAELTPFKYKGKDYYMDGDCNVYSVDEEGELIEDPVGIYDEKTRRITFNS